jgi:hypothetical protein
MESPYVTMGLRSLLSRRPDVMITRLATGVFVLLVAMPAVAIAGPPSGGDPEVNGKIAQDARTLLEKFCTECHTPSDYSSGKKDFDIRNYESVTKKRGQEGKQYTNAAAGVKGEEGLKNSRIWKKVDGETMPPENAKTQPTAEESKALKAALKKWAEAGSPAWPKDGAVPAKAPPPLPAKDVRDATGELWYEVRAIFERSCMQCHEGTSPPSGVKELQVRDYSTLTKKWKEAHPVDRSIPWSLLPWYYVKPGLNGDAALSESLIWHAVSNNLMPPTGKKLSAAEKAVIQVWIAAGAARPALPPRRPYISRAAQVAAVVKHLEGAPAVDRPYQRYFTLAHLHNTSDVYPWELRAHRAGLAKLVNSLSWQPAVVVPTPLPGTHDTVLAIDTRTLGWDKGDLWAEILMTPYPFALATDSAEADRLKTLSGTATPCVRSDWFVTQASRPPLYHRLLGLPDSASELEKRLGINWRANFVGKNLARAGYLGASTTTSGFRVVERQAVVKYPGAYWKSYDFGAGELARTDSTKRNPLLYCLGPKFDGHPVAGKAFEHDGGEVIFNLPNGFQAYLVVDQDGSRLDAPPAWVLKDRNEFSGSTQLVNGISCIACHAQGMQFVTDMVRSQSEKGQRVFDTPETRAWVEAIHPPKEEMANLLKLDRDRFLTAVGAATGGFLGGEAPKTEVVYGVTARYRQHLGLEDVARELDYESEDALRGVLKADPALLKGLGFQARLLEDGKITREEWVRAFPESVRRLKRGHVITAKPQ